MKVDQNETLTFLASSFLLSRGGNVTVTLRNQESLSTLLSEYLIKEEEEPRRSDSLESSLKVGNKSHIHVSSILKVIMGVP